MGGGKVSPVGLASYIPTDCGWGSGCPELEAAKESLSSLVFVDLQAFAQAVPVA